VPSSAAAAKTRRASLAAATAAVPTNAYSHIYSLEVLNAHKIALEAKIAQVGQGTLTLSRTDMQALIDNKALVEGMAGAKAAAIQANMPASLVDYVAGLAMQLQQHVGKIKGLKAAGKTAGVPALVQELKIMRAEVLATLPVKLACPSVRALALLRTLLCSLLRSTPNRVGT